jgi:hypothetical protein
MNTIKFAPIYDMKTAQPIVHLTDIGNHQTNELADGTMTIATNTIDMPEYGFEALASVRLDELELYRLYCVLHAKFNANGRP